MRILFCVNTIGLCGGIERVTIVKANALAQICDEQGMPINKVGIVYSDKFDFPKTVHPLCPSVSTFDTEADVWHDWGYTGIKKYTEPIRKMQKHKKGLQRVVNVFRPDILISVGLHEKFILPSLNSTWPMVRVREIHTNSQYRIYTWGDDLKGKLYTKLFEFLDYRINCHRYDMTYLLTKEDKEENFKDDSHFRWMWNPLSFPIDRSSNNAAKRSHVIIASGRMVGHKDFGALIRAWSLLKERRGDWKLRFLGDGIDLFMHQKEAKDLGVEESVEFPGYSSDVAGEMRNASIFAMTSLFEGFGLVIVEAMSCRLPVVSFDTKYGPRDIIRDGVDGFLVENRDEKIMAERLYQLMMDEELREKMAANAEQRATDFDVNVIAQKWMVEYQSLLTAKQVKSK